MIAVRALMNPAAQAAQAELRLGLRRAIRAVRIHIRRRVGLVQKSIEFLAVMHTRVGHVVLPDQPGSLFSRRPNCRLALTWTCAGSLRFPGDPSRAFAPVCDPGRTDDPSPN